MYWDSKYKSVIKLSSIYDGKLSIGKIPDSKVHGANMGPTWVLSAPDGPHVGPMNLAIRDIKNNAGVTVNNDFWVTSEAICQ